MAGWPHERISGVSRMRSSCGSSVVIGVVSVVPYTCSSSAAGKACRVRRSVSAEIGEAPWLRYRSELTSRGRASCAPAAIASMVGTSSVWVTASRSMRSTARSGSNRGMMTWVPPAQTVASVARIPPVWNIGEATSHRVCRSKGQVAMKCSALETRLRWVCIAPFAAPVVPEV